MFLFVLMCECWNIFIFIPVNLSHQEFLKRGHISAFHFISEALKLDSPGSVLAWDGSSRFLTSGMCLSPSWVEGESVLLSHCEIYHCCWRATMLGSLHLTWWYCSYSLKYSCLSMINCLPMSCPAVWLELVSWDCKNLRVWTPPVTDADIFQSGLFFFSFDPFLSSKWWFLLAIPRVYF